MSMQISVIFSIADDYFYLLLTKARLILLSQIWCNPQQYGHYAQAETNARQKRLIAAKVRISEKDCLIYQPSNQKDALVTITLNHSGNKTPTISKSLDVTCEHICFCRILHLTWG